MDALIRNVARWKATVAGAAGAAAMQAAAFAFEAAHVPVIDFAAEIGSVVHPRGGVVALSAGLLAHATVGIAWALFYAYFFWGRLRLPRPLQGLIFAAIPAILAIAIVHPQLQLMKLHSEVVKVSLIDFLDIAPIALLTTLAIHAVYGLTMGALYTHPVGYRVGSQPQYPRRRVEMERTPGRGRTSRNGFIFATGVECSYPTIDHGRWRRDELKSARHYQHWQRDFDQCRQIGITHLRYGPPLHLTFTGPGKYNWGWIDEPMEELEAHGPEPIIDLCHFGVPDWLETVQNPDLGPAMAEYAAAFAERYPWVRFYTPVNEMYVCSRMSALDGNWNEQEQDEGAFARAAVNLAAASRAMCGAILERRPDAILINSESSDFTQPCCPDPDIVSLADFENERRFLPLDLIFGHELSDGMKDYLRGHGIGEGELAGFNGIEVPRRSVLGIDYYEWNERLIDSDGELRSLGELFGWYVIANQYYQRYRLPMMHTETNRMDGDAPRWLWRQWHNVQLMRRAGVPLIGFTWYSLTDQIDWNIALGKSIGLVFPVGLFDLNRDVRDVGLAYKQLIDMFADAPDFRECEHVAELVR